MLKLNVDIDFLKEMRSVARFDRSGRPIKTKYI